MRLVHGFTAAQRPEVAQLFWQAFAGKLGMLLGPEARGRSFVASVLEPDFAICALDGDRVLGVAGFKTTEGGLVCGGLRDLAAVYGWPGALWRGVLLDRLERELQDGQLLIDGIFVSQDARGQGVGTALLQAVVAHGRRLGCAEVRLDVIDSNPRAKSLYARHGFQAAGTVCMGPLRYVFGFGQAVTMAQRL